VNSRVQYVEAAFYRGGLLSPSGQRRSVTLRVCSLVHCDYLNTKNNILPSMEQADSDLTFPLPDDMIQLIVNYLSWRFLVECDFIYIIYFYIP
jgi:hypothetical protein